MDEFEFDIDERDVQKFDDDLREPFPSLGMECEIPGCINKFYKTYRQYIKHWKKVHVQHIRIYICKKCKCTCRSFWALKRHYMSTHRMDNEKATMYIGKSKTKDLKNKFYIDTKGLLPRKQVHN